MVAYSQRMHKDFLAIAEILCVALGIAVVVLLPKKTPAG